MVHNASNLSNIRNKMDSQYNLNYRGAVQTLVNSNPNQNRHGDAQVRARYATYNRILSTIFKSNEYCEVMLRNTSAQ